VRPQIGIAGSRDLRHLPAEEMTMQDHEEGRRAFVRRGALTFLAVVVAPSALTACGGGAVDCTVGVTPDQLAARTSAHYLENAHSASRNCAICTFFTPAPVEGQCGPCSLNMGAVNPLGICDRFAERA
jgi:hypothetical protein